MSGLAPFARAFLRGLAFFRGSSRAPSLTRHLSLGDRAIKKKHGGKFPVNKAPAKKADAAVKAPRFYPAEDVPKPFNR